jgi:hypothetical protein
MQALNVLTAFLLLSFPRNAQACAVCFGSDNQEVLSAFIWGAGAMILTVFTLLFFIIRYILRTERAKKEQYRREGLMDEGEEAPGRFSL